MPKALNACHYCRSRKSKCDEKKPCSNCVKRGLQCYYNREVQPSKLEKTLHKLYQRIDCINELLLSIASKVNNGNGSGIEHTPESSLGFQLGDVNFDDQSLNLLQPGTSSSTEKSRELYLIPSFEQIGESYLNNCNARRKMLFNEDKYSFKNRFEISSVSDPFFNKVIDTQMTNVLLESYLTHIFPFYPIVCEATVARIKEEVFPQGINLDLSSCTLLILLALGSIFIVDESTEYWSSSDYQKLSSLRVKTPPGWEYCWKALELTSRLKSSEKISFETISLQLLLSIYYLKIGLISDHWIELSSGAEQLRFFIDEEGDRFPEKEKIRTIYWIFLHMEREISVVASLQRSSLSEIQDKIPIPEGCISPFPRDKNEFYVSCYLYNIFLSNISDRAASLESRLSESSFHEVKSAYYNFKTTLSHWRLSISKEFFWDEYLYLENKGENVNLIKLYFYLTSVRISKPLISRHPCNDLEAKEISQTFETCLENIIKSLTLFSRQKMIYLNPSICINITDTIAIYSVLVDQGNRDHKSLLLANFKTVLDLTFNKIRAFALHSPLVQTRLEECRAKLNGM